MSNSHYFENNKILFFLIHIITIFCPAYLFDSEIPESLIFFIPVFKNIKYQL